MANENYFKQWYDENGKSLNSSRRERYATDPVYRKKILARNKAARQKRKLQTREERERLESAKRVSPSQSWKTVQQEVKINGRTVVATLFSIGALAKSLGRGISTVRVWEKKGLLPETPYRSPTGDRLYTLDMVESIRRTLWEMGKLTESDGKLREKKRPEAVVRWVQTAQSPMTLVPLYKFGVLAQAVNRTVVALIQMEKSHRLPKTPLRASSLGYRLYTVDMIEVAVRAFKKRGSLIRSKYEWAELYDEIETGWRKLGVDKNAHVLDRKVGTHDES